MSLLVLTLPPHERLGARSGAADAGGALRLPAEWPFVLSADGRGIVQQGVAAAALLPRADTVTLVLAEGDVSWHRVAVPRAPAARLRAALLGVMEEALLEDEDNLHFALAPDAQPGQEGWVAVTNRPRLQAALAALEAGGRMVERVVAASSPQAAARGHVFAAGDGAEAVPVLSLARADGVALLRLNGGLARALVPDSDGLRFTATPAAAAAAERWLGAPVALATEAERALEAAQGTTNLRQFDLAPRHRGARALREGARKLLSAEWRPVRWGLAAVVVVHLVGLNVVAWKQERALAERRAAMDRVLKAAHPGVRAVLNAPLQMQRETALLRAAAGRPGDTDLEALLGAAAAAWPDGQGPVQTLRFESGKLLIAAAGFGEPQMVQFRDRLRGSGYVATLAEGRIELTRDAAAKGNS